MNEGIPTVEVASDLERINTTIKILEVAIEKDTRDIDREIHTQALKNLKFQRKTLLEEEKRHG